MHNGAMITKPYPPTPTEVRLTIPVSAHVHAVFTRIAKAGKVPVGRAMGEWLADTVDAAAFMADKMEQARAAPALAARELHSYALGLTDMTQDLMKELRQGGSGGKGEAAALPPFFVTKEPTPSSNTGGKVPTLATKAHKPTRKS